MIEHQYFEELCATVAGGLASDEEFHELERHLGSCEDCRERLGALLGVGAELLARREAGAPPVPAGMTSRFVERAVREGIPLRRPLGIAPASISPRRLAWPGAIAAAVTLAFLAGSELRTAPPAGRQTAPISRQSPPAALSPSMTRSARPAQGEIPTSSGGDRERLRADLSRAAVDEERLERQVACLSDRLKAQSSLDRESAIRTESLEGELDRLRHEASAKDAEMENLRRRLALRDAQSGDQSATLAESQIEIRTLRDQLAERDATIDATVQSLRQTQAAGSDARNLIIARNLHIIDVHDNNGDGKGQRAFGRIFYTEGKQLIFYAYDLDSLARLRKQVAFYVWGGRLGDEGAVRNLGVFRNEDAGAGRWSLTFGDPHVLAEINTVFVTAESKQNVVHPDGKKLLYAFLGDRANHP